MPKFSLSLYRVVLEPNARSQIPGSGIAAILAHEGALSVDGETFETGEGGVAPAGADIAAIGRNSATALIFVLSDQPPASGVLKTEWIETDLPCLLRLDEVAFPPGAQAYRHVHPGAGFRHLRRGQLHLEADDHAFDAYPGDTWFEATNSPVRATASDEVSETRFVRCMVLPPEFEGKPTINILDPKDAARPKRQVTHRHVDHRLETLP